MNSGLYVLWKLKQFGVKLDKLLTIWKVLLRPITEYAAPLWHSGLLAYDSKILERLQKTTLGLILGTTYVENKRYYKVKGEAVPYEVALTNLDLPTLAERRETLTRKFALDTFNNPNHKEFFDETTNVRPNARFKPAVQEYTCGTDRLKNSAIPYMSRLLNNIKGAKSK